MTNEEKLKRMVAARELIIIKLITGELEVKDNKINLAESSEDIDYYYVENGNLYHVIRGYSEDEVKKLNKQ